MVSNIYVSIKYSNCLSCVCSVDSLSVVDLGAGVKHRKVVSLAEGTEKASSLEVSSQYHYVPVRK